jgi:iron complex outermembrane receptor protein
MKQTITYFALIFFGNFGAFAQTDTLFKSSVQDVMSLPVAENWQQVKITTASLTEENANSALAMTRVITEEQIRLRGYRSLKDLLEDLPDFQLFDASKEQIYNNYTVRGVYGQNKFVLLLDGVRISPATNETIGIFENYPINFAKQVEVIYGATSAIYGADAMMGVINIITKTAEKNFQADAKVFGGNFRSGGANLFLSKKFGQHVSLRFGGQYYTDGGANLDKIYANDTLFNMSSHQTGVFNTIFGTKKITNFTPNFEIPKHAYGFFAALDVHDFSFNIFSNYHRSSSSISVTPQNTLYNSRAFYANSVLMANAKYRKSIKNVYLESYIMANIFETDPQSNYVNAYVNMQAGYKYAHGSQIKLNQQLIWQINKDLNLVSGATLELFNSTAKSADLSAPVQTNKNVEGTYAGSPIPAKFFILDYSNIGTFAQFQYTPSSRFSLTVGSRFDYNSRFGATFNPRLGAVYHFSETSLVKLFYGSAFLAPSPENAFQHYGSFVPSGTTFQSFFMYLPNPDLQPIRSQNLEVGFSHKFSQAFSVNISAYYMKLNNLLTAGSDKLNGNRYNGQFLGYKINYIETPINLGNQENIGGSVQLDYSQKFNDFTIKAYAALSYIDGKVDAKNDGNFAQIGMLSPFQFKMGGELVYKKFSISPRLIWVSNQRITAVEKEDASIRQSVGSYTLINLALRYEIYKQNAVFINIRNLTNQKYRVANENANKYSPYAFFGVPQDPLRFEAGINLRW